jgi:hypothetical protein
MLHANPGGGATIQAKVSARQHANERRTRSAFGPSLGRRTSESIEKPEETVRTFLLVNSNTTPLAQVAKHGADELTCNPELDSAEYFAPTLLALLRRDCARLSELIKHHKSLRDG